MRLCFTGAATSPGDEEEKNPGPVGLTAATPAPAHPRREPWAPWPAQGGVGCSATGAEAGAHCSGTDTQPRSPAPWPRVHRACTHRLIQPSRSSAPQGLVPEPRNHSEAVLPGDRRGRPRPPALAVEGGPRLCYFKLDAPPGPLLSRIRATCRSADTADLALCKSP